jgi:excisionase family DNA binding protein
MSVSVSHSGHDPRLEDVLTLAEAAAYLRVPEEELARMAARGDIPAQQIGGEWRLLKKAVNDWLRWGPRLYQEMRMLPPPWVIEYPSLEELLLLVERRVLDKLAGAARPTVERGSRQAVLKHFGVFREDDDLEEQLADVRRRREAGG